MMLREALAVLELQGLPDAKALASAFSAQARKRHPDTGGSPEAFRELVEARKVVTSTMKGGAPSITIDTFRRMRETMAEAREVLDEIITCGMCRGTGYYAVGGVSRRCTVCNGSGER